MKKTVLVLLILALLTPVFAQGSAEKKAAAAAAAQDKLIIQTMATFNGVLSMYIRDKGWTEEAGLDVEYQVYANGSVANEALAAGLWDIGYQGAAYVFGSINNNAKIIGNYEETRGDTLFVRSSSDILKIKGYNPTYREIYGNPATVKGKTIIYAAGTSLHQLVIEYLERVGVSSDDMSLVPMDYQTGEQVFATGEGDIVALPTPWSLKVTDKYGWLPIATLSDFVMSTGDILCSEKAYETKKDAIVRYMKLVYRAADELEADHNLKAEQIMKWYKECGKETSKEAALQEAKLRIFITTETQKNMKYGAPESAIADFYASIGNIEPEQAEQFKKNIVDDLWKAALNVK